MDYKKIKYEDINFDELPEIFILSNFNSDYEIKVPTRLAMRSNTIANMVLCIGQYNDIVPIFMSNINEQNATEFMDIAKEFYDNINMLPEEFNELIIKYNIPFEDLCLFIEFSNFADFPELYNAYTEHFAYLIRNRKIPTD
jgi:hypothetical protein